MRFVWAVLAFVLAAVLIGAGIAQRTIFLGPKDVQTEISVDQAARYTMIDGDVLRTHPGQQTIVAHGDGALFASQARTADLEAWLSDETYNRVSLGDDGELVTTVVEPEVVAEEDADAAAADGTATDDAAPEEAAADEPGRDPAGSDLWLDEMSDEMTLVDRMQIPDGVSVLVASDGTADAPQDVVVSWPLDTATPWAGPLIVLGLIALVVGLVLYFLAFRHQRRGRGPLRKAAPPLPTEPIDVAGRTGAIEVGSETTAPVRPADGGSGHGRRARRALTLLPALGLTAVLATGCSPDAWPQFGAETEAPTPTPTATAEEEATPAVTPAQADRILASISETLTAADESLDGTLAATRLDGVALTARQTAYAARTAEADYVLPPGIPSDEIRILVPQSYDRWPRSVLALVESGEDETVPPIILTMTQQDPWSQYKVTNISEMQASAELPDMAPEWLGAKLTPPDSPFLEISPAALGAAFASVVDSGADSEYYDSFDERALAFAATVTESRNALVNKLAEAGAGETSAYSFAAAGDIDAPVAFSSIASGAIVAVTVTDAQTIAPTQEGVDIRPNAVAKALTDTESSTKGYVTTYAMQLFFSVPAQGSAEPVALLAASQQLLSVEAIQ